MRARAVPSVVSSVLTFPLLLAACALRDEPPAREASEEIGSVEEAVVLKAGTLTSNVSSTTEKLGAFEVRWDAWALQLSVTDAASGRVLWQGAPRKAFLLSGVGDAKVSANNLGSVAIKDKATRTKCTDQTLSGFRRVGDAVEITGSLWGPSCAASFAVTFHAASARRLELEARIQGTGQTAPLNRTVLVGQSRPEERFYGFGEQFTFVDLKGKEVPIIVQEQGHGRGLQPITAVINAFRYPSAGDAYSTYAPMPYYLTSDRRGFFLGGHEYAVFDLTAPDVATVSVFATSVHAEILRGDTLPEIIEGYTEVSGRMQRLPRWFHEKAVVGGFMNGSAKVRALVSRLRAFDVPVSAMWIEDWCGLRQIGSDKRLWWNWEVSRDLYPDFEALRDEIRDEGMEVIGYVNPFLTDPKDKPDLVRNLYEEARALGYLVTKADGTPYPVDMGGPLGIFVDLSNPQAFEWLKGVLKRELLGNGLKGWMADFGEGLPWDGYLANGKTGAEYRNEYVEEWARVNMEAIREAGLEGQAVYFLRAGYTRTPRNAMLMWAGDQLVTWDNYDGMASTVSALISSGLSGVTANHSDIGGLVSIDARIYKLRRTAELMQRWMELNAFSPLFRTHEGFNPKHGEYELFGASDEDWAFFSHMAKVYAALADYRDGLYAEASARGIPIVRHMMLEFPDDPTSYTLDRQYMLGPDVLVAPVLEPGKTRVQVYLPAGSWTHLWSGVTQTLTAGSFQSVDAPLGRPAVFVKAGSSAAMSFRSTLAARGLL